MHISKNVRWNKLLVLSIPSSPKVYFSFWHWSSDLTFYSFNEWYKEMSLWSFIFYLPCWSVTGIWSTLQQCTCSGGKVNCPHGHLFPEMKSNEPIRPWHFGQYNLPLFQHPYKKTIKKNILKTIWSKRGRQNACGKCTCYILKQFQHAYVLNPSCSGNTWPIKYETNSGII